MGNVIAFLLGTITGAVAVTLVRWHFERRPMRTTSERPTWRTLFLTAAFVIALSLVGFGVQQSRYQEQQREYDQCVYDWGTDLASVLDRRVRKNKTTIEAAQRDVFIAAENLLRVLAEVVTRPPEAGQIDLSDARRKYAEAGADYAEAERQLDQFREANPYPELDC